MFSLPRSSPLFLHLLWETNLCQTNDTLQLKGGTGDGGKSRAFPSVARQKFSVRFWCLSGCQAAECGTRAGNDKYA